MGNFRTSKIFRKEKLNNLKKWIKMNKKSKFFNQLLLTWNKISMDWLFSIAEIKFIQSNHGVFKRFAINQSESSINFNKFFSFLISTNQNRLSMVMEILINFMSTNQNWVLLLMGFSTISISNDQNWISFYQIRIEYPVCWKSSY